MNQPSLTQLAKQGNEKAITSVLNHLLESEDIITLATLKAECLFVVLEGKTTPDQEKYVAYIQNFVNKLELNRLINKFKVIGRRKGGTFAAWNREVRIQKIDNANQGISFDQSKATSDNETFDFATLSQDQQIAFCGALFALAAADGSVDSEEVKIILDCVNIDSLPEATKRQLQSYLILPPPLESCLEKLAESSSVVKQHLILYFLEIALVDKTLSPEEAEAIKLAQIKLNISDKQLHALQSFVNKMKGVANEQNDMSENLTIASTTVVDLTEEGVDVPELLSIEDPNFLAKNASYYSDEKFTDKIKNILKFAGKKIIYNALVLYLTAKNKNTPLSYKAVAIGALGYFILPIDLIPDALPVIGLGDDMTAMLAALKTVGLAVTPEIEQAAQRQVISWFGENP